MKRNIYTILIFLYALSLSAEELKIKTASVQKQQITKTIEKTGTAIPWKTVKVSPEISGLLEKLNVDKGTQVDKNMILAEVDRRTTALKVQAARTRYEETIVKKELIDKPYREEEIIVFSLEVEKAEEDKKHARNTYKRISKLFSEKHASQEELDAAENKYNKASTTLEITKKNLKIALDGSRKEEVESAENEVQLAKKNLEIAENDLKKTRIISVVKGTVANKYAEEGEFVTAGRTLIEIIVLNPLKITFAVSEQELSYLHKGSKVEVGIPVLGKAVPGEVIFISPIADAKTHLFNIELQVPNEDKEIYPGMTAKIHIATNKITAYPIRTDWLRFNEDKLGVFVLSGNKVKFIPVNQKNYLAEELLLFKGFEEGDKIIIFSSKKLVPGGMIKQPIN